jgi:hypothetical protein
MCRHLTDFAAVRAPKLTTCSLADMVSLNPADIVTLLKFLFIVVIALFGLMNGGALLGYVLDARARSDVVARLCQPDAGFRNPNGDSNCWVWRFTLEPLVDDIDAPSGTAVTLSAIMGIPYVRLRAALPDEMAASGLCNALGRKEAFSVSAMTQTLDLQRKLTRRIGNTQRISKVHELSGGTSRSFSNGSSKVAASDEDGALKPTKQGAPNLEEFVGTALVLAYLQASSLMSVVELARHISAATRFFEGVTTPAGRTFEVTCTDMVTMLSPGILDIRHKWLLRARKR